MRQLNDTKLQVIKIIMVIDKMRSKNKLNKNKKLHTKFIGGGFFFLELSLFKNQHIMPFVYGTW